MTDDGTWSRWTKSFTRPTGQVRSTTVRDAGILSTTEDGNPAEYAEFVYDLSKYQGQNVAIAISVHRADMGGEGKLYLVLKWINAWNYEEIYCKPLAIVSRPLISATSFAQNIIRFRNRG